MKPWCLMGPEIYNTLDYHSISNPPLRHVQVLSKKWPLVQYSQNIKKIGGNIMFWDMIFCPKSEANVVKKPKLD